MDATKICTKCDRELSLDKFTKNKTCKDGLSYYCRECAKIGKKEAYDKKREVKRKYLEENPVRSDVKICTSCGKELTLDKFNKIKTVKSGLKARCKTCDYEYTKEYIKKNKEKVEKYAKEYRGNNIENAKEYRQENKEKINEYARQYYIENIDAKLEYGKLHYKENTIKINIRTKRYYREHIEESREYSKQYRKNNPDKMSLWRKNNPDKILLWNKNNPDKRRIYTETRRARKLLLPSTFTVEEWKQCKINFDNKCCYCGKELPLQQEHFIALTKGGGYVKENIICACKSCNASKNDSDFFDWYPSHKSYDKDREDKILEYLEFIKEESQQLENTI